MARLGAANGRAIGAKRKLAPDDSYQAAKAARTASSSDAKGSGKGKGRLWQSSVEAVPDDDDGDDGAAGDDDDARAVSAEAPPAAATAADNAQDDGGDDDDAAYGPAEEEDRFFGGGISRGTAELLDFIEQRDEEEEVAPEKIDALWLRKFAINFERRINANAELRAKFESEPQKFMASEADLDAEIKSLSILAEHPELYDEFVRLGSVKSLVSLLSHENSDIAIDAIQIISELTDEDVAAEEAQWDALVDAMLEADILELVVQNFARLDESNESDRSGVYHALSVIENFASKSAIADRIGAEKDMLPWLLRRIGGREAPVSQNKQYAAEILEILLQSAPANRARVADGDGVDTLLQAVSAYRKRDPPKDTDEAEFMENVFDCLTCMVREVEGKNAFVAAEGVELCLIMLRDGRASKPRALRLLDHALQGQGSDIVGQSLVEAAGLKPIFGMLMKKHYGPTTEHLLGILSGLLQYLPADSASRIRTLAKFVEKDYEKTKRILELRQEYASRLKVVDAEIDKQRAALTAEGQAEMEDEWLSRRLDAGLFCAQAIDLVLAWLAAEDYGARTTITSLLKARGQSLDTVTSTLKEQLESIGDDAGGDANETKEMLRTLIDVLQS